MVPVVNLPRVEPPESGGVVEEETAEYMELNVKEIKLRFLLRNDVPSEIVFLFFLGFSFFFFHNTVMIGCFPEEKKGLE